MGRQHQFRQGARLLWPIKKKYGLGLSWGDLFILAGTTAVEHMGGPILGFCAGRVDDPDGTDSLPLGPSPEQEKDWPCKVNGTCQTPLGSTTVGLIYLNPEGPMAVPHPAGSAPEIRDTFLRMNMNDTETVALIGGGHALGRRMARALQDRALRRVRILPILGRVNAALARAPTRSRVALKGLGQPTLPPGTTATLITCYSTIGRCTRDRVGTGSGRLPMVRCRPLRGRKVVEQDIMMMTSDISLLHDKIYTPIVKQFAADPSAFDHAWKHAWYKLTTRDMGPVQRCVGKRVPPPQPWQFPLPKPPSNLPDYKVVATQIEKIVANDPATNGGLLLNLAWRCAATYRYTDYRGGCNGARIRFEPESEWLRMPIGAPER